MEIMTNIQHNDDDELRTFLKKNIPQPTPGSQDLENRILLSTALKPSLIEILWRSLKMRKMVFVFSPVLVLAVVLVFFFLPHPPNGDVSHSNEVASFSTEEQNELAEFMEGAWRQSVGDSELNDFMENSAL